MTRMGYRDRHDKFTLISCFSMMIILVVAGYFIIGYGLNSAGEVEARDEFLLKFELYSEDLDFLGNVTIFNVNETFIEELVIGESAMETSRNEYSGTYLLYYAGARNDVHFGPVTIGVHDLGLVLDSEFFGIRLTVTAI